ncbi:S8 family peptidase [Bacillus cereus]|uniref:S8 family peptidase n=1 Tax=Bacillus cereus TaxID=1396 RepID=UPI0025AF2B00|nr:S8 family serine peptidase [Bacillus cereus]WJX02845.1 S8 family serine peptidase [Bacillus cereus]
MSNEHNNDEKHNAKPEAGNDAYRFRTSNEMHSDSKWVEGIIEVEFHEGIQPNISKINADKPPEIRSLGGEEFSNLNKVLKTNNFLGAEMIFDVSEEINTEAAGIQETEPTSGNTKALSNLKNFMTFTFPKDADVQTIASELRQLEEVKNAVPVPKAIPPQSPLDEPLVGTSDQVIISSSGLENQWYIFRCKANQAWNMSLGDNVVIADIDWGYRITHQDLSSRLDLSHAYNSYDGGTNVSHGDSISHGTAVMGIAGGADNGLGMSGFAPNAVLWPIQANSGPGPIIDSQNTWARAIDWVRRADSQGKRKIINLEVQTGSFGNYESVLSVNAAIRAAIADGVVVCVAAGNGDRDASIDDSGNNIMETGSILVGATEYHPTENRRAGFSNYGSRITVSAPGDASHDITCDSSSDINYRNGFGGTSGATPKVSGTVALMLSVNPSLTHQEIRTILNMTGTHVVTDSNKPVGTFLNSEAAVREAQSRAGNSVKESTH